MKNLERGKWTVVALLGLGLVAAAAALRYQHLQGRAALAFWGPAAAQLIGQAETFQLVELPRGWTPDASLPAGRNIAQARGAGNVRRALLFDNALSAAGREQVAWQYGLRFAPDKQQNEQAVVLINESASTVGLLGKSERRALTPAVQKEMASFLREVILSLKHGAKSAGGS